MGEHRRLGVPLLSPAKEDRADVEEPTSGLVKLRVWLGLKVDLVFAPAPGAGDVLLRFDGGAATARGLMV